ncbi:MAG: sulfatase-like hydrolase/transferase, partial [Bacteroidales bacterium]|nr:sulfatase-like hydrolase/transferase [Bacteroidales bacterium]
MKCQPKLLPLTAFTLAAVSGYGQSSQPHARPNILFITTDYHAALDVPWETGIVKMPFLESLAEDGVVFSKHYCTAPISMPARYTLITGMYPHYHGEWDNQSTWIPDGTPVLMEQLSNSGYRTLGVGKMHFHPWDRDAGFDVWISAERKGNSAADTVRQDDYAGFLKKAGLSRASYLNLQGSGEIYGVYDWPFADSLHIDHYVGEQSRRLIEAGQESPWFMWVSFNGPHNPWDPPAAYSSLYLNDSVPEPVLAEGELRSQPYDYTDLRYNYTRRVVDMIDENPEKRIHFISRIRAGHYGGLTFIDEQLGKILTSLRETGQIDNTIIIFTADHGAHLGDHDLIHKGTHYDRSARVPMVIWFGNGIAGGTITGYSAHVDMMPTILDMAGAPIPESLEGTSLMPVIRGEKAGDDHAIIEIRNNYSRISDEYIFGVFPSTNEEVLID